MEPLSSPVYEAPHSREQRTPKTQTMPLTLGQLGATPVRADCTAVALLVPTATTSPAFGSTVVQGR